MAIRTFKRVEKKYLVTEDILDTFLKEVAMYMNADAFCAGGDKYTIYNIYFDDEQDNIIKHSLSKPYYKEKLRLRSYTPFENEDGTVYLELKKKIGNIVSKRRCTMTLAEAMAMTQDGKMPNLKKYLDNQVAEEIMFFLRSHTVRPAANISYDRQAFFGKDDSGFRLTLDSNINARSIDLFSADNSNNISLLDSGNYIMEIKILGSIPLWLTRIMSELCIRKVSFSKYGTFYKKKKFGELQSSYVAVMPHMSIVGMAGERYA